MKIIKSVAALSFSAMTLAAFGAETYNFEAGLFYGPSKKDDGQKTDTTSIRFTSYFKPVSLEANQPFLERSFLQRASSIGLMVTNLRYEDNTIAKTTVTPLMGAGTIYFQDFIFEFGASRFSETFPLKANTTNSIRIKSSDYSLGVGYFILPTTSLIVSYQDGSAKYSPSVGLPAIPTRFQTTTSLKSHTVNALGNDRFLVLDLSYDRIKVEGNGIETNNEYGIDVSYYPVPNFYLNGGYSKNTGDDQGEKGYETSLGIGYAITPRLGLLLSYAKFNGDVASERSSGTTTLATVGYRF